MNRLFRPLLGAVVATAVAAPWSAARACDPVGQFNHTVDPSMQPADQTPPTLPAVPRPLLHYAEDSAGCGGAKCGDATYAGIPAVATDDMTPVQQIGYRVSLASGTLPPNFSLPTTAVDPIAGFVRLYFNADTDMGFDFILQVVAIDLAGNESAPQTVRVTDDSGHACAVARGRAGRTDLGWAALLALVAVAYRQRRR
jgi:MYXO-CTERM domain-containing protein